MTTRQPNGAAIRALRERTGIPHGEFAERIGNRARNRPLDPGYLTKIEKGKALNPSPDILRAIADELGVPLDAITTVVDARPPVPA